MKRFLVAAALVWLTAAQRPALAAESCYSPAAMEADQGIRFLTELMVASSICEDRVYPEFRLRNKDAIIAYQKALIAHYHSTARFDAWNTALANEVSLRQNSIPYTKVCQQAAAIFAKAKTLDDGKFRAFAAAQAASASAQYRKCGK
jgi:hypothetical protein